MIIDEEYLNSDGSMPEWLQEFVRVSKHIENALEYNAGTHNIEDIMYSVAIGEMQLWTGKDSVIIGQIVVYPQKKVYHMPFVGGNLEDLREMAPSIIHFARYMECSMITTAGRRGWDRVPLLKELGFEPMHYAMKMEI